MYMYITCVDFSCLPDVYILHDTLLLKVPINVVSVQRYLYYINNGVDTEHVAPLEDSWILNILQRVGSGSDSLGQTLVAKFGSGVEFLSDEIKEEYLLSVKKSIGKVASFYMYVYTCMSIDVLMH